MKSTLCLFFGLLLANAFSLKAQDSTTVRLTQLMQDYPVIGLSIAVVKDGKVVHTQALGWKEEGKELLESSDLFRIASISKSFTATGLMQLVEKGTLSLDDDVSNLIGFRIRNPKFPDTVITLRMLLSHTSSINDDLGYFNLDVIHPDKNKYTKKAYNVYEPGKGYQYCNLNFNLAGAILEKYAGLRLDQYIKKNILDPLEIYGGYNVDQLDVSRFAKIYAYDKRLGKFKLSPIAYESKLIDPATYVLGYSTPLFSPTGGMKISAPDLAKYMIMHMNLGEFKKVRLITEESSKAMQTPVFEDKNYGLGLRQTVTLLPDILLKGHTGSAYGLYSGMFFNPEEKYGFVVVSNGCDPTYEAGFNIVIRKAFQILHEEWILNR
jgi:CubicO group peptidase (beta-lactamase class C family)